MFEWVTPTTSCRGGVYLPAIVRLKLTQARRAGPRPKELGFTKNKIRKILYKFCSCKMNRESAQPVRAETRGNRKGNPIIPVRLSHFPIKKVKGCARRLVSIFKEREIKMKSRQRKTRGLMSFLTVVTVAFITVLLVRADSWSARYQTSSVPPRQIVPVDIEPGSCPNPLVVSKRGEVTVAILGTDRFDVTEIDRNSIRLLEVVQPLQSNVIDVATPYRLFTWDASGTGVEADSCTDEGPDGKRDLVLTFEKKDILKALGSVKAGSVLVVRLTARHKSGASLVGQDVVVISRK